MRRPLMAEILDMGGVQGSSTPSSQQSTEPVQNRVVPPWCRAVMPPLPMVAQRCLFEAARDWKLEAQHGKESGECPKAKGHI
jgi:hypothetical protein